MLLQLQKTQCLVLGFPIVQVKVEKPPEKGSETTGADEEVPVTKPKPEKVSKVNTKEIPCRYWQNGILEQFSAIQQFRIFPNKFSTIRIEGFLVWRQIKQIVHLTHLVSFCCQSEDFAAREKAVPLAMKANKKNLPRRARFHVPLWVRPWCG